ncbi:glycosyltransferase family 4 protein [Winogradskyella maritima]|uniref:Glycosyltransferase family 4 protein n=1 Tax=Winogradskyella maritima TaxID=1517766 RepID=A0ABV8AJX0_9FLAO|nr:glycosyltransferase family 4 protein [Winogradskyella maritima]
MEKRTKILYTIPNFDTAGSGKVVYDLVKHIDKTKFEPHIACGHTRGDFFKQVEQLNVPIHVFNVAVPYKPYWNLPVRLYKTVRFFKSHYFDIIHSWHWSSDFTEPLAAKLAGIPFVYTKKAMGWGNKAWRWRSQLSTHIITINQDMREQFFNNMSNKTSYIPIGVDTGKFKLADKNYTALIGTHLKEEKFVIVTVANLVPIKGIEVLLEAMGKLENPDIVAYIIGDYTSDYGRDLKQQYETDQVIFTGKKRDVRTYLQIADLFVICTPEIGEGQPIAPIEAMLSGRLVIGSNISGIKDVLSTWPQTLVKPNDIVALGHKIKEVIEWGEEKRMQLANEQRQEAQQRYALSKSIMSHMDLYANMAKS